jgi:predicted nuclease of predicted toxin-antitoxin system
MRFLADEGCDLAIIYALQQAGHDVTRVAAQSTDQTILAQGFDQQRIIIHHDTDFGELIFNKRLATYGTLLLRLPDATPDDRAQRVYAVVAEYGERLRGQVTRISATQVKQRPADALPSHLSPRIASPVPMPHISDLFLNQLTLDNWQSILIVFDVDTYCRVRGIRASAWYGAQQRQYKQHQTWQHLKRDELCLLLALEARKLAYNDGKVQKARIQTILDALHLMLEPKA